MFMGATLGHVTVNRDSVPLKYWDCVGAINYGILVQQMNSSSVNVATFEWMANRPTHYALPAWLNLNTKPIAQINQSNFYSANIPGEARLSGANPWVHPNALIV